MNSRVRQIRGVQKRALKYYEHVNGYIPKTGSTDGVLQMAGSLSQLIDAEVRHVALLYLGLRDTMTRLFVECLCALAGSVIKDSGEYISMPRNHDGICEVLCHRVFAPRNKKYDDSFSCAGAVGVVIRLMDHVNRLRHNGDQMSIAHIANYVVMAMALIEEAEEDFLECF